MTETAVSNEVLLAKMESMSDVVLVNQLQVKEFQGQNKEEHSVILAQVQRTNGRVTTLEKAENMLVGGLVLVNVIMVPVFLAVMLQYLLKK